MKNLRIASCCPSCEFVIKISEQDEGIYYYCNKVGKPFKDKYRFLTYSTTREEWNEMRDWFKRHKVEDYNVCDFYKLDIDF